MTCTYHEARKRCTRRAVLELRWYDVIYAGWAMTVERVFCQFHADEAIARLAERGVTVGLKTIAPPVPVFP